MARASPVKDSFFGKDEFGANGFLRRCPNDFERPVKCVFWKLTKNNACKNRQGTMQVMPAAVTNAWQGIVFDHDGTFWTFPSFQCGAKGRIIAELFFHKGVFNGKAIGGKGIKQCTGWKAVSSMEISGWS